MLTLTITYIVIQGLIQWSITEAHVNNVWRNGYEF